MILASPTPIPAIINWELIINARMLTSIFVHSRTPSNMYVRER